MESELNEQPNDNSTRQADSIGSEDLDAAILAAVERANDVHSLESPAEASNHYVDAGFDMQLIDPLMLEPLNPAPFGDDAHYILSGMIMPPSYYEYEEQNLSPQVPISPPVEEVKLPQSAADDAVLGGQNQALVSDAVLGGIEGVKRCLASTFEGQRIAAITEALKYGQAGLELVIEALNNDSKLVSKSAYCLLRYSSEPIAQQALQKYNPYRFFECTFSGNFSKNREAPIAITPDSQTLAYGGGSITLWNLQTGKRLRTIRGHSRKITSLAISSNGQTLVSGSYYGSIKIWNLHTGIEKGILEGHSNEILSLAISPDGKTLVSGSYYGIIKIWNLHTGENKTTLKIKSRFVTTIAISLDNQTMVIGGDGRIETWNMETGKKINSLKGKYNGASSVAVSPDGQILVSRNTAATIKVWHLATGEHLHTINDYLGGVNAIAISPDSLTLISGSTEGTINFWNLLTGKKLHTLKGSSSSVHSIAISPDGQTLVSSSNDGTIKVWGMP